MERWHLITIFLGVIGLTVIVRVYSPSKAINLVLPGGDRDIEHTSRTVQRKSLATTMRRIRRKNAEKHKQQEKKKASPNGVHVKQATKRNPDNGFKKLAQVNSMFTYDEKSAAVVIDTVTGIAYSPFYSDDFVELFKVLDKNSNGEPYYKSDAYRDAYMEMDKKYSDVYLWTFLTNRWSKFNLFAYLLKKYSENNKRWSPYKEDKADCTQFSERAYFFMYPGEIVIKDMAYFEYLFSSEASIMERNKHINKIPTIFYARIRPFIFQDVFGKVAKESNKGHAMVGFSTSRSIGSRWIIGEPQNGNIAILSDLRSILPARLKIESNIFTFGTIIDVPADAKQEPNITNTVMGFMYYNNPNISMDMLNTNSSKILGIFKKYAESQSGTQKAAAINRIFDFLEYKIAASSDGNLALINLQEWTSTALNIIIRELESIKPHSSGGIILGAVGDIEKEGEERGYMDSKNNMAFYISQLGSIVRSKLQYWGN